MGGGCCEGLVGFGDSCVGIGVGMAISWVSALGVILERVLNIPSWTNRNQHIIAVHAFPTQG